jgi:DNA-binding NtrC family response regulator
MSTKKNILIIDDEKNIRFTLKQTLESLELNIEDAINGEEALKKIREKKYNLLLLDLKMPGIDGMDVLRIVAEKWPDIKIIIITAHGTIDSAVEAMKLGAVDFLQKPFAPAAIRELVSNVLERDLISGEGNDYDSLIELAKKSINEKQFDSAIAQVQKAITFTSSCPEAYNLLGVLMEVKHDQLEAQKNYRIALSMDPGYQPALTNLHRSTSFLSREKIDLGDGPPEKRSRK